MSSDPQNLSPSCIFCKILAGLAPAKILFRDELVTAVQDSHPIAPVHFLVIPNRHIATLEEATSQDEALLGHMALVARQIASQQGIRQSGYRLVINSGPDACERVPHLHVHLLARRQMTWPPG